MKLSLLSIALLSCIKTIGQITWVSSTAQQQWVKKSVGVQTIDKNKIYDLVDIKNTGQTIEGFGTCFNELGWLSLSQLSQKDQNVIFKDLFKKGAGANFVFGRMPIAANDFAIDWYSFNETDGDFEMKNFNIDHDKQTLIPFIKKAQQYNPTLKMWASPWCPPSWMKTNNHYASKAQIKGVTNNESEEWGIYFAGINNGLDPQKEQKEGENSFIQDDRYFDAYARYFGKFVDSYAKQNIKISMVMPQNEFNSAQPFPSCTWTVTGLNRFMQKLGPEMSKRKVDLFFGTMERKNPALVDSVLADEVVNKYIKGVGFQWDGKYALPVIHQKYPNLKLYQSEQECGNGKNDWKYAEHTWDLMKHYLSNGVSAYMYWNTSLPAGNISRWGWKQNSLISVDETNKTYKYNYDYFMLKHLSHFVLPGSKFIDIDVKNKDAMAFVRPDGKIAYIVYNNSKEQNKTISLSVKGNKVTALLEPQSINSFLF